MAEMTLEELLKNGAKPAGELTAEELVARGARPASAQSGAAPAPKEERSFIDRALDAVFRPYPETLDSDPTTADVARSALQGVTFGGADEAAAAIEAPFRAMGEGISLGEAFDRGFAEIEPLHTSAMDKAPSAMIAGGMLMPGGNAKQAAGALQRFGPNLARSVVAGTAAGAGMAKPGERIEGALKGGATSMLASGAADLVGKTLSRSGLVNEYLRRSAADKAAKAVGVRGGITNSMQKMNIKNAEGVRQLGREALDADLIPFGGSKDAVLKRAETKMQQLGPAIDSYFEQGDRLGKMNYDDALVAGMSVYDDLDDVALKHTGKADDLLDSWATARDRGAGFLDTRKMNTSANKTTNHAAGEIPMREEVFKDVKRAMRENTLKQLEETLPPGEVEGLRAVNSVFSTAKKVQKLASNAGTREAVNRSNGLIGTLQGQQVQDAAGGGSLGGIAGFVWPRVESVVTARGPAAAAISLDAIANAGGKYGPLLQEAKARGPMALAVQHYLLATRNPDYRASRADEDLDDR